MVRKGGQDSPPSLCASTQENIVADPRLVVSNPDRGRGVVRIVPKPEGFELRDRRSDKTNDATAWLPEDALYDAQQAMDGKMKPTTAMIVAWFYRDDEGIERLTFRLYNRSTNDGVALAAMLPGRVQK